MQTGMWMSGRARQLGGVVAFVASIALSACGGGGHDRPPLEVSVSVDGVTDANMLTSGESTTINAPSGATLVFSSEAETRWEPVATDSSFTVNSFSLTSKSLTVTSNGGGSLVVVFSDNADAGKKATLTVTVAPKEFERLAVADGESSDWTYVRVDRDDHSVTDDLRAHVQILDNEGNYSDWNETLNTGGSSWVTTNYDAQDRMTGINYSSGGCTEDAPVVLTSYPLHVGKQWSGTSTRTCSDGRSNDQSYERTVEAFERISVLAGDYDALRIRSVSNFTNVSDTNVPGGAYSATRTCWWATTLGRNVKCEYAYAYPEGTPSTYSRSLTQTMTHQAD